MTKSEERHGLATHWRCLNGRTGISFQNRLQGPLKSQPAIRSRNQLPAISKSQRIWLFAVCSALCATSLWSEQKLLVQRRERSMDDFRMFNGPKWCSPYTSTYSLEMSHQYSRFTSLACFHWPDDATLFKWHVMKGNRKSLQLSSVNIHHVCLAH